ncbi:MAG: DUF1573 domain-containing protein [Planctomycetota bacterium]
MRQYYSRRSLFVLMFWLFAGSRFTLAEQKPMPIDRAIKLFAKLELQYKALEWTIEASQFLLKDANDPTSVSGPSLTQHNRSTVRFDPHARRYLVKREQVGAPQNAGIGMRSAWAFRDHRGFDGRVYRSWKQGFPSMSLDDARDKGVQTGVVSKQDIEDRDFPGKFAGSMGFGFMPPMVYDFDHPPMPLSKLLALLHKESPTSVDVTEDEAGGVTVNYRWMQFGGNAQTLFSGIFDVNKGGICLGWTITVVGDNRVWKRVDVIHEEFAPGLWAPREVNMIEPMEKPPVLIKQVYTDVRVNPPLDAKAFIVEFPIGTFVDDSAAEKSYVVTGGAIDEQTAIKEFISRNGLKAKPRKAPWFTWPRFIVAVSIFAAIAAAVIRWKGLGLVLIVFTLRSNSLADERAVTVLKPEPVEQQAAETAPDYFISHHPAEKIRVAECGFTVTVFVLEHFSVAYDLARVKAALPATEKGVKFADIQELLGAYGLECEARQGVKPAGLAQTVKSGYLAIFPLSTPNKADHYLVGMLRESGEPAVVDVLKKVYAMDEVDFESHGTVHKGVVLFVRPAATKSARHRQPINASVKSTPRVVELGAFPLDGPEGMVKRRAEIVLENTSSKPVLVKAVSVACGCTELDWNGGIIRAGAKQTVSVTARPLAWGAGKQRKSMAFKFLDDSELKVEIVGEGQTAQKVQNVTVSPQQLRFEIDAAAISGNAPLSRELAVTGDAEALDSLKVIGSASWLSVEMAAAAGRARMVRATVSLKEAMFLLDPDKQTELVGELRFSTKEGTHPLVVAVTVIPKEFFTFTVPRLELELGESAEVVVVPVAEEAKSISISKVQSDPVGLDFDKVTQGNGVKLVIRSAEGTAFGVYVVRCHLQADSGRIVASDLIVRLKPKNALNAAKPPNAVPSSMP